VTDFEPFAIACAVGWWSAEHRRRPKEEVFRRRVSIRRFAAQSAFSPQEVDRIDLIAHALWTGLATRYEAIAYRERAAQRQWVHVLHADYLLSQSPTCRDVLHTVDLLLDDAVELDLLSRETAYWVLATTLSPCWRLLLTSYRLGREVLSRERF